MLRAVRSLAIVAAIQIAYALYLLDLWRRHGGLLLTSADDASRLLIAHVWGAYGIFPMHWTWPPMPMLIDGVFVSLGGDVIVCGAIARITAMSVTGLLLATFWQRTFARETTMTGSFFLMQLLWLFFPVNVRLALSGLSEPYLYALIAIGLVAWQHGVDGQGAEGSPQPMRCRARSLVLAGLAFGASTWCRYEGAILVAVYSLWLLHRALVRVRRREPLRETLRSEVGPLVATAAPPLAWLALQYLQFGDPLFFVWATRAIVAEEALLVHGQTHMPVYRMLATLRTELWTWPVGVLALVGALRLRRERRAVYTGVGLCLALYVCMAAVSIGGRMQYYFNLFSMLVLPLAVKGAEGCIVGALRLRSQQATQHGLPRYAFAQMLLAGAVVLQVGYRDVPALEQQQFGDWLSPRHRELFLGLRRERGQSGRSLLVLDSATLEARDEHQWDSIGLQVADPRHAAVLPYRHALAPNAPLTPWFPELAKAQDDLLRKPSGLREWASERGFSRVMLAEPAASG